MRALALLLALLLAWPCQAAGIGAPVNLGTNSAAAGSATIAITTIAPCPAGSMIIVLADNNTNVALSSITDSLAQTYTLGLQTSLTVGRQRFGIVTPKANLGLASGSTITATFGSTTGVKLVAAACVSGLMVRALAQVADTDTTGTIGSSTSPSITTAALASNAEIVFCGYLVILGAGDTFTNTAGFTGLTQVSNSATLNWEYKIVSATTAVTCAPTLGTSRSWGANARGYIQTQGERPLSGVGQ